MSVLQFPENLKMTKRAGYDEWDKTDSTETRPLLKVESPSSPSGSSELSMAVRNKPDPKLDDVDAILPIAAEPTLHILVAEHDPVTRAHLKSKLENLGHDVQIVVNGKDCVSLYRTVLFDGNLHPFDIVLMGITMDRMNGNRAIESIREAEKEEWASTPFGANLPRRHVPVFAISGGHENENSRLCFTEVGFDGWIPKPIDYDRLEVIIKSMLSDELRNQTVCTGETWKAGGWFRAKGE